MIPLSTEAPEPAQTATVHTEDSEKKRSEYVYTNEHLRIILTNMKLILVSKKPVMYHI